MSESIAEAEQRLALCLEAMRDALQLTIEDALPQSTLGRLHDPNSAAEDEAVGEDSIPDTLRQRLEWERQTETERVAGQAREVLKRTELLRRAVVALGGGNPELAIPVDMSLVMDVPVNALDREIEVLSAESSRLGNLMVDCYAEAAALAHTLESKILRADVPPL